MSRRVVSAGGVVFLSLVLLWAGVYADVVHLRDGRVVEGTVTSMDDVTLVIVTSTGTREYPVSAVDYVERTPGVPAGSGDPSEPGSGPGGDLGERESSPEPVAGQTEPQTGGSCLRLLTAASDEARSERLLSGAALAGIGLAFAVVAANAGDPYGLGLQLGLATFTLIGLPGVFQLVIPSRLEREHARVLESPEAEQESVCATTLKGVAENARTGRYLTVVSDAAAGVFCFWIGLPLGTLYFAVQAVRHALLLSDEERLLATYEAATE